MKSLKLKSFINISILFLLYELINTQSYNNNSVNIEPRLNIDPLTQDNNNGQNDTDNIYKRENRNITNDDFNNGGNILNNDDIISNNNQTPNIIPYNENNQEIPNNSSDNIKINKGLFVNHINVDNIKQNITKEDNFEKMANSSMKVNNQNEKIKTNLQPAKKKKSRKIWYIIIFVLIGGCIYYYRKRTDNEGVNYSQISKYSYYDF